MYTSLRSFLGLAYHDDRRAYPALLITLGLLVAALPASSFAQGFGVYEQGTCTMARAGATVASACGDGSSLYFNPANLAGTEGFTASVGATLIDAQGEFAYDYTNRAPYTGVGFDLQNDPIPVPHGYFTYGLTDRLGLGLGLYVPYGLETNWPTELPNGQYFDGAFEGFENRVQAIYVQPTVAYQVTPRLRVGGGPILAIASVQLNQIQDLSQTGIPDTPLTFGQLGVPFHTAFSRAELEGNNDLGFGANVGATFQATERLNIAARFMTPITVSFDGEAQFTQIPTGLTVPTNLTQGGQVLLPAGTPIDGLLQPQFSGEGTLTTQGVETELTFPFQLVGGISFQATDKLLLLADYQFTGWSAFDEIPLEFEKLGDQTREEGYESTHAIRFGADYDVLPQLAVRAGYLYNTSAAPDEVVTPLLPEAARNQFTVGLGWHPTETLEIGVAYQLLLQNDRRGRVRGALPGEAVTTDLNQGLYSFGANLFGTTLTLHL